MEPSSSESTSTTQAAEQPLPSKDFYSVQYPGYVKSSSVPLAVQSLGGQSSLDRAFRRSATKNEALLELNLRPGNPFAHPIPGDVVGTNNILLKITKRKRRRINTEDEVIGDFTAEAVGVIPKTVRFRSMADYQYMPNVDDPVTQLRFAMDRMDVQAIKNYTIPTEKEDYTTRTHTSVGEDDHMDGTSERSNLRLPPPPIFSRQGIPQLYNYKANNMSVLTTVVDPETGEERKRLINKSKWRGYGPSTISFAEQGVPTNPPQNVQDAADSANLNVLATLKKLFEERPCWTRAALNNQLNATEIREVQNSKILIPLVGYVFQDGPWRDTLVRLGYDPRDDPNARLFQRIYFRNLNHPVVRPSVITRRQEGRHAVAVLARNTNEEQEQNRDVPSDNTSRPQSHIFDGVTLSNEVAAFQLCDVHDPMLKGMIEDEEAVRDVCNERDGWYTTHAFERIKDVLRFKFFSLLDGHIATDEECVALLERKVGTAALGKEAQRKRAGKHNMAKGALPVEDAAVARLRATLDSQARKFRSRKPLE
ncbi:hypothetical protein BD410DRAFT_24170 [Rickenella mellea]|uniref:Transcription factor IIIC subunit 5 HTH domain-containing protein n=1 Tax=Rickenella mellea TaxID=50990 RepID=A0A4R5XEF4_9AGAM|nr:hypothetical protein BD410DRAFT_24170 [Rickenella mellea]